MIRREASWHEAAIREAYASGDPDWVLTAVFAMEFVNGFEKETLEALKSTDLEIHIHAVAAAGNQELPQAWPHIRELLRDFDTEKDLLIAAIGAAGNYATPEALDLLADLSTSHDEEIADAADEALAFAMPPVEDEESEGDEELEDDEEDEDLPF